MDGPGASCRIHKEDPLEPDRRTFVTSAAAVLVGATRLAGRAGGPPPAPRDRLDRIGVQLYTVRAAMAEDFDGTLARIADIGYDEVEFAGYFDRDAEAVRAAVDAVGLAAPSVHLPFSALQDEWDDVLEAAAVIGHEYLICPSLPGRLRATLDGYREAAEVLNRAGEAARRAGMRVGYHNHDVDFTPIDGRVPYDVLLDRTDPDLVTQQLDLFWIVKAGKDPLSYFTRYPGRFSSVHVKDMDGSPQRRMVDVGQGVMDFAAIFARHETAGIQHYFVEHDNPADPFASVRVSYEYLAQLRF